MKLAKPEIGLYAGSKVPQIIKQSIDSAIKSGNYLNESDFIRDAIREKLQREGFLPILQQTRTDPQ
jgi:Arc/MetJ-type ribon-helix-helix transcriptional regulator